MQQNYKIVYFVQNNKIIFHITQFQGMFVFALRKTNFYYNITIQMQRGFFLGEVTYVADEMTFR